MADIQRVGDLEISQDLDYQERMWQVERVGWWVMGLTTLAGLLGLLGPGLLGHTVVGRENDPIRLEFERFGRWQSPTALRVYLGTTAQRGDGVQVALERNYLEGFQVQQVTPEPESVEAQSDRLVYHFRTTSLDRPTAVTFYLQPERIGLLSGSVGLEPGQTLAIAQWIYP
jgi:hypothetical protein